MDGKFGAFWSFFFSFTFSHQFLSDVTPPSVRFIACLREKVLPSSYLNLNYLFYHLKKFTEIFTEVFTEDLCKRVKTCFLYLLHFLLLYFILFILAYCYL